MGQRGVREGAEMTETEMPALWNTVFYAKKGRNFNNIKRKKSPRNYIVCVAFFHFLNCKPSTTHIHCHSFTC